MQPSRLALLLLTLLLLPVASLADDPPRRGPNVVVFLIDDMGWADLGCYGSKDIKTPNVDRLAKQGVRLTNFYSNGPVCTPTRAALMTGRWQQRVGLEWAITAGQREPGLPASETSLARMLKGAGYRTALCGKWHLGYKKEFGPNAHGFDEFFGLLSGNVDHYSHKERIGDLDWYEDTKPAEIRIPTELIADRAAKFIERQTKEPFFLYVAFNAVHWPFQPPGKPDDVRTEPTWFTGAQDYVAMMESVDAGVGKVLARWRRQRWTATPGDLHGRQRRRAVERQRAVLPPQGDTLGRGIRVPCLRWPGKLPEGKVSEQPAITMDPTATVLAACGAAPLRAANSMAWT
jgi:N-acetylgalactosamine-6-sulfatase